MIIIISCYHDPNYNLLLFIQKSGKTREVLFRCIFLLVLLKVISIQNYYRHISCKYFTARDKLFKYRVKVYNNHFPQFFLFNVFKLLGLLSVDMKRLQQNIVKNDTDIIY